jgi:hypothetical protein
MQLNDLDKHNLLCCALQFFRSLTFYNAIFQTKQIYIQYINMVYFMTIRTQYCCFHWYHPIGCIYPDYLARRHLSSLANLPFHVAHYWSVIDWLIDFLSLHDIWSRNSDSTQSANTYFQCGPFYWVVVHTSYPTTHRGAIRKDGVEIPRGWSLPECITSSGGL